MLLYWLVPKRCVPLEADHMFSNGGLVCFSLNSQMNIYIPRDLEHICLCVYVCACDGKSQRVRVSRVRVCGRDSPQLQCLPWLAQGRVTQSRTERVPICHSCGPLHSKLGFSLGTSHCVLQAHMGHGISMSTMHDHILCLGLGTQVVPSHAHQQSNVTMMMLMAHLICRPASSEVILYYFSAKKSHKKININNVLICLLVLSSLLTCLWHSYFGSH